MVTFIFTKQAAKAYERIPKTVKARVSEKLKELKTHDDIFSILKRLENFKPATHRLRIGNYRLILELWEQTDKNSIFWVLDIGHRKDIYK